MNFLLKHKEKLLLLIVIATSVVSLYFYFLHKRNDSLYTSYISLAEQQLLADKNNEAVETLSKAIDVYPRKVHAYSLRAYALSVEGKYSDAIKDTDTVISISENNPPDFYKLRGDLLRIKGETDQALKSYEKAYTLSPLNNEIVHSYVGGLMYFHRDGEAYIVLRRYFKEAKKEDYWDDIDLWIDRAMASISVKRCTEANVSSYHANMRAITSEQKELTEALMSKGLNEKNCIDTDTFGK